MKYGTMPNQVVDDDRFRKTVIESLIGTYMVLWSSLLVSGFAIILLKEKLSKSLFGSSVVLTILTLTNFLSSTLHVVTLWFWVLKATLDGHVISDAFPPTYAAVMLVEILSTIILQGTYLYKFKKIFPKAKFVFHVIFYLGALIQVSFGDFTCLWFLEQDYSVFDRSRIHVLIRLPASMLAMDVVILMFIVSVIVFRIQGKILVDEAMAFPFWTSILQSVGIVVFAIELLLIGLPPHMSFLIFQSIRNSVRIGIYLASEFSFTRKKDEIGTIQNKGNSSTDLPIPLNHQSFTTSLAWLERTNGNLP
ncbi:hypothetical protein CROQUDRAFT_661605 [Cronartium quercuum f. sp. fusiforme G11]|uniref:Uncharacterized protein n=1 Tax=Cronartium quercuum f. sp. fusiforme G11 TaxID=708437 RepID=A0A9P6NFS6_9BASI|nr:hypothetical protein CROQUDRAFT_661605 [Cronartium quercuum f. sp. fusiforme G11]